MSLVQARSSAGYTGCRNPSLSGRRLSYGAPRRGVVQATSSGSDAGPPAAAAAAASAPPDSVRLTLRKPLGVVFEQKTEGGPIYVAEVTEGGAAARSGKVQQGDILSRCSAVVLKAGKEGQYQAEGYGQRPYDNWEVVDFNCEGKEFKTVMSALRSNNERWGIFDVTLELRKP